MSEDRVCSLCRDSYGVRVPLHPDPSGFWACERCGLVDESITSARALVDHNSYGIEVDDSKRGTQGERWTHYREAQYEIEVETLLRLYLGIPDASTSILGVPAANMRSSCHQWFLRMREAERKHFGLQNQNNKITDKMRYLVVVAIKMAADESSLVVLNNRLKRQGVDRGMRAISVGARGDERIPAPTLFELFDNSNKDPTSFGRLHRWTYLSRLYRQYSRLLHSALLPLEANLIMVANVVDRLKALVRAPAEERNAMLSLRPTISGGRTRDWRDEDFSFFQGIDLDLVLPHAYNLYQLQQCVCLWGKRANLSIAVPLALWGCMAVAGSVLPAYTVHVKELMAHHGESPWGAMERFKEMRNLIVAWSTSIADAGLPIPTLPMPPKSGFGNGIQGYGGDRRRGIPEQDMAAVVVPVISANWRRVLRARYTTRRYAMPLSDEIFLARKIFVAAAWTPAMAMGPQAALAPRDRMPGLVKLTTAQKKVKDQSNAAKQVLMTFGPLLRARGAQSRTAPAAEPSRASPAASIATARGTPLSGRPSPASSSSPRHSSPRHTPGVFVPPPREPTIDEMLAIELSSDEESENGSSDDDGRVAARPSVDRLGRHNASNDQRPFAFTIGPQGFEIEKSHQPPQSNTVILRPSVRHAQPGAGSSSSSLARSTSSALQARRPSSDSDSGVGTSSAAEGAVRRVKIYPPPITRPHSRTSRSPSASAVSDTARSSSSTPASRSLRDTSPYPAVPASEEAHVGILLRERDEYIKFRYAYEVEAGSIVSPEIEAFMWRWLREQIAKGSIPPTISSQYLRSIGIAGDPKVCDLGRWMKGMARKWSPVECLLRAGIKPVEIPPHFVPHSMVHLNLLLNHFTAYITGAPDLLAPIGAPVDEEQLDEEMTLLFIRERSDGKGNEILSKEEAVKRRAKYEEVGYVGLEKTCGREKGHREVKDYEDERVCNEDGEYDELNSEYDDLESLAIAVSERLAPPDQLPPATKDEIMRIRAIARRAFINPPENETEALLRAMEGCDDLGDDDVDRFVEAGLGAIGWDGVELDFGDIADDEGGEEEDQESVAGRKGKGKGKQNVGGSGGRGEGSSRGTASPLSTEKRKRTGTGEKPGLKKAKSLAPASEPGPSPIHNPPSQHPSLPMSGALPSPSSTLT
ncbi:hypothetical protein IAT38_007687 [Cryptococcus sp. DSM 104549]